KSFVDRKVRSPKNNVLAPAAREETQVEWDDVVRECSDAADGAFMATVGADGRPHVAWVGVGFDGDRVWTATDRPSQKAKNLQAGSDVALHWPEDPKRLIFMRATARMVEDDDEVRRCWDSGVLPYEPTTFWSGPDDERLLFVELVPQTASVWRGDITRPPDRWRRSGV
ncbi:hypothetical protein B7486_75975, partial [cyanobacterium TDX16]